VKFLLGEGDKMKNAPIGEIGTRSADGSQRWCFGEARKPWLWSAATMLLIAALAPAEARSVLATPVTTGPAPIVSKPAPSSLTRDAAHRVLDLVGPAIPVQGAEAMGPPFARYERNFRAFAEKHWHAEGGDWETAYYYDRAKIYYVWWARTGNAAYLDRANALLVNYRTGYVEPSYDAASHWTFVQGLALHFLVTGDEKSRLAVGRLGDNHAAPYYMDQLHDPKAAEMDNRIQARVLEGFLWAHLIGAPSPRRMTYGPRGEEWGEVGGNDWAALLPVTLDKILSSQAADGSYKFKQQSPFMAGILNDVLIDYYTLFEPDPRIPAAVKKSLDYMWTTSWVPARNSFKYDPADRTFEGQKPAPDLNHLIVNGFGWIYKQTGETLYRERGDAVFAGGVQGAWLDGSKQFNQSYATSYRYLAYRR
jgi:hypothetical protein